MGVKEIKEEAVAFYSSQLQGQCEIPSNDLLFLIPRLVTAEDNRVLTEVPQAEEVRRVVFSMNGKSAGTGWIYGRVL